MSGQGCTENRCPRSNRLNFSLEHLDLPSGLVAEPSVVWSLCPTLHASALGLLSSSITDPADGGGHGGGRACAVCFLMAEWDNSIWSTRSMMMMYFVKVAKEDGTLEMGAPLIS